MMREYIKHHGGVQLKSPLFWLVLALSVWGSVGLQRLASGPAKVRDVPVTVLDLSEDPLSRQLTERLAAREMLDVTVVYGADQLAARKQAVIRGRQEALYVIPAGFQERVTRGETQRLIQVYYGENRMEMLTEGLSALVMEDCLAQMGLVLVREACEAAGERLPADEEMLAYLEELPPADYPMVFLSETGERLAPDSFRQGMIHGGLILLGGLSLLVMTAYLPRDRENGVFRRLKVMGREPWWYGGSGYLLSALVLWLVFGLGSLLAGTASLPYLALGLGFLLGLALLSAAVLALAQNRKLYFLWSPVLVLALALLWGYSEATG